MSFKKFFLKKIVFIFRERGREGERKRNIHVWLPLTWLPLGTWPATQACALTGNRTSDPTAHAQSTELQQPGLYVLFGEVFIRVLCPFFNQIGFFVVVVFVYLALSFVSSLQILDIDPLSGVLAICSPTPWVVFLFCWWFPLLCKTFLVWCSPILLTEEIYQKEILLWAMSKILLPMFCFLLGFLLFWV